MDGGTMEEVPMGKLLEKGWDARESSSALQWNAEVWELSFQCNFNFKVLKAQKLTKSQEIMASKISEAEIQAAKFIRDVLLRLGPTFVKLGQVVLTRTNKCYPKNIILFDQVMT
jgi:predicted unusual protein kinase regulating ubiquinone biosynthesis (AarF/ABC1/UbiB family)